MAIDTRDKRASCVNFTLKFRPQLPLPDGSIALADRVFVTGLYSGITAGQAFTATSTLSLGSLTLAATSTFAPGTHSAAGALTLQSETLAGSATFAIDPRSATSVLTLGSETLSASATFGGGTHSATAALSLGSETLAGVAAFSGGTHSSTASLSLQSQTLAATASTPISYQATSSLSLGSEVLAATATFVAFVAPPPPGENSNIVMTRYWVGRHKPRPTPIPREPGLDE